MRFYPEHPDRLTTVRWFFVADDTPFVPHTSAFTSRVWDYQDEPDPPYGEMNKPRPWRGGQKPASAGVGFPCGTPEQWRDGCKDSDPVPPSWPGTDIPRCCGLPALQFVLGSRNGPKGETITVDCADMVPWPDTLKAQCLGGLSACGIPDGYEIDLTRPPGSGGDYDTGTFEIDGQFGRIILYCLTPALEKVRFRLTGPPTMDEWGHDDEPDVVSAEQPDMVYTFAHGGSFVCAPGESSWRVYAPA